MPPEAEDQRSNSPAPGAHALLLLCFFLSGLAALIYQTAWTRQFAFVFGTSELAVASVLAAYMGGLALGAAVIAPLAPRIRRPLLAYGILELAIGLAALAVPYGVRLATGLYVSIFGARNAPADEGGLLTALFYLACSFAILLVPTALMGATLPLLARHAVRSEEEIGSRIAQLYAMNTAGAVAGTLLTGFVFLPALGLSRTVGVAVAANLLVFGAAAVLARRAPSVPLRLAAAADPRSPNRWILPVIAASGFVSFTYEVLWTRLLGHVLGGSVYAFATMLATFLAGIALGSALASGRLSGDRQIATRAFAWAQVGTALLSGAAFLGIDATPGWAALAGVEGDARLLLDAGIAAAVLLPGALCIGATFPLAVRILARGQEEAGPASARVYAWNTLGAITGAVGAGFFLIPAVGFTWTLAAAVSANALLAATAAWRARPRARPALALATLVVVVLVLVPPEPPWKLLRAAPIAARSEGEILYFGVGRSATVLVQPAAEGWTIRSNGLPEALVAAPGGRAGRYPLARWLGALPGWGRPDARSMLIVGFGGGLVVEAVAPGFEQVDVVEIESEIIRGNESIGTLRARDPLADPRLELIVNDARSALLLTEERYDAIVSQPSHPWTSAASHLYTREFFQEVRQHLAEDGVFIQWMGLAFVDEELLQTLVATLLDVFPQVRVYQPAGAGVVFTASAMPFEPEKHIGAAAARDPEMATQLGIHAPEQVLAHMVLDEQGARAFADGAAVGTDDRNLLQMRSPGIVRSRERLDLDAAIAPFDPLARSSAAFDRLVLIRRLLAAGRVKRAQRLAREASDPSEKRVALALVANARGKRAEAIGMLRRVLKEDAGNTEAQIAFLGLRRAVGSTVRPADLDALGPGLEGSARLLSEAWQLEDAADWPELRALDGRLASIGAAHPAFSAASRLRAAWRIGTGDPSRASEAIGLLDGAIALGAPFDALVQRARACEVAGLPAGVVSSLHEMLGRGRRSPPRLRQLLQLMNELESLPPGERDRLRAQVQGMLRG